MSITVSAGPAEQLRRRGWDDSPYGTPDTLSAEVRYGVLASFRAGGV